MTNPKAQFQLRIQNVLETMIGFPIELFLSLILLLLSYCLFQFDGPSSNQPNDSLKIGIRVIYEIGKAVIFQAHDRL